MIANRFFEGGIKFAEFDELFERIMEVAANYRELIVLEGACGHDFFFSVEGEREGEVEGRVGCTAGRERGEGLGERSK